MSCLSRRAPPWRASLVREVTVSACQNRRALSCSIGSALRLHEFNVLIHYVEQPGCGAMRLISGGVRCLKLALGRIDSTRRAHQDCTQEHNQKGVVHHAIGATRFSPCSARRRTSCLPAAARLSSPQFRSISNSNRGTNERRPRGAGWSQLAKGRVNGNAPGARLRFHAPGALTLFVQGYAARRSSWNVAAPAVSAVGVSARPDS